MNPVIREDVARIIDSLGDTLNLLHGRTILIAGGSGFLCAYLVDVIAAFNDRGGAPCRVIVLDNLSSGQAVRLRHLEGRGDITFLQHDVSKPLTLEGPVDFIVHGASIASPTFYRQFPLETIDANVTGTATLLKFARERKVRGFLYISTSEIYGDPPASEIPTSETYVGHVSCVGPRACYDESKRLGETLCSIYTRQFGVPVKTIRPFNVYGPGQRLDDKRLLPDLMAAALKGAPLVLYSDGRATRAFCYVSDAVTALLHVLLSGPPGEVFNIGNDEEEISVETLARRLVDAVGDPSLEVRHAISVDPQYLTDNPKRRCPNLSKTRGAFGWRPAVPLAEGLRRTFLSYR